MTEGPKISGDVRVVLQTTSAAAGGEIVQSRKYDGFVVAECPVCRERGAEGTVDTRSAATATVLPNGLSWGGVSCSVCGTSYTIEATENAGD
jgi:hypothetical protein